MHFRVNGTDDEINSNAQNVSIQQKPYGIYHFPIRSLLKKQDLSKFILLCHDYKQIAATAYVSVDLSHFYRFYHRSISIISIALLPAVPSLP